MKRQPSLLELVKSTGLKIQYVAEQVGFKRSTRFYQGALWRGRASPQEIDRLASALRMDRNVVEDALRENARRNGG